MFYAIKLKEVAVSFIKKIIFIGIIAFTFFSLYRLFNSYFPLEHLDIIYKKADKYNLEPEFVCGVIRQESRFRKDAISKKGASGLMQIMEPTAYWIADELEMYDFNYDDIFEPEINIEMGCWYIRNLLDRYDDVDVVLSAYNAGSGNVSKWLSDESLSNDGIKLMSIPFPETEEYVLKVKLYEKIYKYLIIIK